MAAPYMVTEEMLRRLDKPGPRYTSYPTAVEFHSGVAEPDYRRHLRDADAEGSEAPLSLYCHLPFCEHRCLFCGCNVVITPHRNVAQRYLDYVGREIDMVAEQLPRRRSVAQMQWGGGTPTYYSPDELAALFQHLSGQFAFAPDAEIAIEVDPRVTSGEQLERLARLGFNRLSLGVQDFTPDVQRAITRNQTLDQTRDLMLMAREVGFSEGINIDLVYGLPGQQLDTFADSLHEAIALRPDRVAVYSFAYVPWIRGHQKKIDSSALPSPDLKLGLYVRAMEEFLGAGYEPIGMDHFALPDDELAVAARERRLHRNFMGYTVKPASDMVAFGISGIGDVQSGYFQNAKKLSAYYRSLDDGRLPIERGYILDQDDCIRRHVITQLMCNFHVDKSDVSRRFGIDFDEYFSDSLEKLVEPVREGFVELTDGTLAVTDAGRLFVRNVCMAFDRYLESKSKDKPVFSRTV